MGKSKRAKAKAAKKFPKKPVGAAATSCPTPFRIHIHLDSNRDGAVDPDWWLNRSWTAGKTEHGAVVLCNCDDEDADQAEDHTNDKIDGADDDTDIAPFYLRKHPKGLAAPKGWKIKVEVLNGHHTLFRIFDNEKAAGKEVLGPTAGASFTLTDLSKDEWKYGMEVNQFPGRIKDASGARGVRPAGSANEWDGYVVVKLTLFDDKDVEQDSEEAKIRCAPWVIFTHMDPTEELYVAQVTGGSQTNATFISDLDSATGFSFKKWPDGDRWMQDVMEIGYSTLPRAAPSPDMHLPAPILTANARSLASQVKPKLLNKNYGYYEVLAPGGGSSLDSFGNLECVPPFIHSKTSVDYKFGRIIFGYGTGYDHVRQELEEFLLAQKVQFPFKVDTGWLIVGHIDEVMTIVPTTAGKYGFKLVFASPKLALSMIAAMPPTTPCFALADRFPVVAAQYTKRTVAQLLDETTVPNIVKASKYAQEKIDKIKEAVVKETGITDADCLELPVLFQQNDADPDPTEKQKCIAYTAGAVNMLVVTDGPRTRDGARTVKLCIPKPFGPTLTPTGATGTSSPPCEFEKAVTAALSPLPGVTLHFIDDFITYHALQGEIHCGTNSKRKGPLDRFWWEQPGI